MKNFPIIKWRCFIRSDGNLLLLLFAGAGAGAVFSRNKIHGFQRAMKRSEMEIFNLFMRWFLTIKFNDDVINKSKKLSLILLESLLFRLFELSATISMLACSLKLKIQKWKTFNLIKTHKHFLSSVFTGVNAEAVKRLKSPALWLMKRLTITS